MLLGVDIGTGGCKVTLIDHRRKRIKTAFREYETYHPKPTWSEQDPEEWYSSMVHAIREVMKNEDGRIDALSIDGQTHAAVLVDDKGKPLRRTIIWTDKRSVEQVNEIKRKLGEKKILEITYNPVKPLFTLPQLLWIMEVEPEIWKRARAMLMAKDYMRYRLTGEMDHSTDYTDAMGTLLFDAKRFEWSREICDAVGVDRSLLPEPVSSDALIGHFSKRAAEELGISEGTPIIMGCHDVSAEPIAAGAIDEGDAFIKLATAGVISVTTSSPKPDMKGRTVTYCLPTIRDNPPGWFTKTATTSCGSSYRWFRDTFCEMEVLRAREEGKSAYQLMDELAEKVPPGSMVLIYHPYLEGEGAPYYDPNLRGSFIGITSLHKREHFCRAVLEGIAFSIMDSLEVFQELGIIPKKWSIIGGGAKSRIWCQIISDVFGVSLIKPAYEDASFGTAVLAGVGIGVYEDFEDALEELFEIEREISPNIMRHEYYAKIFGMYRMIRKSLDYAYHEISKLQQEITL